MKHDPITQIQSFAMEVLFRALGVSTYNRTCEEVAWKQSLIPQSLKVVHYIVNEELRKYAQSDEFKLRPFCRFKAGDTVVRYEVFPTSISIETVRQALTNYGWREPRAKVT